MPVITMLIFLILFVFGVIFVISALKKGVSGLKIMLLGINITLFGGIIAVDPNSSLGGFEYLIVLLGLIISTIGLWKKD